MERSFTTPAVTNTVCCARAGRSRADQDEVVIGQKEAAAGSSSQPWSIVCVMYRWMHAAGMSTLRVFVSVPVCVLQRGTLGRGTVERQGTGKERQRVQVLSSNNSQTPTAQLLKAEGSPVLARQPLKR